MKINLGRLLLQRFQWLDAQLLSVLSQSEFGEITRAQSMVFAALDTNEHTVSTISDIGRQLGISRQAAQKTISELVSKDLLILEDSLKNKSAKEVKLTEKGRNCVHLAKDTFQLLEDKLCQQVGKKKMAQLREALECEWKL